MEVEVRIHSTDVTDAIRAYATRRVRFALGRFGSRVPRVVVRLSDTNGTRGGVDQRCQISADVVPSGKVVLEQVDADLFTAIDRASDRVGQALSREIRKSREARTHHDSIRTLP